jgi:hypothetical protein
LTFIKRFFKAIDPSLKIDVGGIIQECLMFSANKSLLYRHHNGSSIAITSGSINATTSG